MQSEKMLTFRDLKKERTDERVRKSFLDGKTMAMLERIRQIDHNPSSSSNISIKFSYENVSSLEPSSIDEDDLFMVFRGNDTQEMLIKNKLITSNLVDLKKFSKDNPVNIDISVSSLSLTKSINGVDQVNIGMQTTDLPAKLVPCELSSSSASETLPMLKILGNKNKPKKSTDVKPKSVSSDLTSSTSEGSQSAKKKRKQEKSAESSTKEPKLAQSMENDNATEAEVNHEEVDPDFAKKMKMKQKLSECWEDVAPQLVRCEGGENFAQVDKSDELKVQQKADCSTKIALEIEISSSGNESSETQLFLPSASSSNSSNYCKDKDVLEKLILKHGECGPKRLLLAGLPKNARPRIPRSFKNKPPVEASPSEPSAAQSSLEENNNSPVISMEIQTKTPTPAASSPVPEKTPKAKLQQNQIKRSTKSRGGGNVQPQPTSQSTTRFQAHSQSKQTKQSKPKNFQTIVGNKSFVSKGSKAKKNSNFAYDLSHEESAVFNATTKPMREVPEKEQKILKEGFRRQYLEARSEKGPVIKYHYPEATSWRHGWLLPNH